MIITFLNFSVAFYLQTNVVTTLSGCWGFCD